jgi:hypothetical protein
MCPRGRHSEHIRKVRAAEAVAQVQLDDLGIGAAQRRKRGPHHGAKVHLPIAGAKISHRIRRAGRLVARRGDTDREPSMALVAGHGKQPRSQAAEIAQPGDLG